MSLFGITYRISPDLRVNVLLGDRKMDQVQVNVSQAPGLVLLLSHTQGMLPPVVGVPELGGDEDVLARHAAILDALADFVLVTIDAADGKPLADEWSLG